MARGKPYFSGMTKGELKEKCREIVNKYKVGEEFRSDLISNLILDKHYFCSLKKVRPEKFRKTARNGPGYNFEGYFQGNGWHRVSWSKSITPPKQSTIANEALRLAIQPILFKYKELHPICEVCKSCEAVEVDHVNPEFKAIVTEALSTMNSNDWHNVFVNFDWWNTNQFRFPENNSALQFTLKAHETAILQSVCKACHLKNAEARKKTPNKAIKRN